MVVLGAGSFYFVHYAAWRFDRTNKPMLIEWRGSAYEEKERSMALTRKFLASKGIDANVIDEIITAHTETVSGLKDELDKANGFKEKAEKLDAVEKELADIKAEVAKNGGKSYEALKKEFDDFKADVAKKEARAAKETAYREVLKDAGIPEKHFAKVLKYSDVDGVELDDQGKIKGAKDLLKSLKDEWGDLVETSGKRGAETHNPPAGAGSGAKMTKEEIMKITDTVERQKAMMENPGEFGIE